jgi:predicted MFS family arabinose efflux permease
MTTATESEADKEQRAAEASIKELGLAFLLSLCFGTVMLDRMSQLFLGPYIASDLHLSGAQIGLLAAVVAVGWAASSLVMGRVSDKIGRKMVLVPAMIAFSLLSALSGFARNYSELLLLRGLLGLAEGPCWSVIMALMEGASDPKRRGRNLGVVNCAGSLVGSAVGPVLTTQIASALGWRAAFFVSGAPGILLAAAVMLMVTEPRVKGHGGIVIGRSLGALVRSRDLWLCFAGAIGLTVWIFGFNVFAPLYLTQRGLLSPTKVGWVLSLSGVGGFVYSIVWSSMSDRIGRKPALLMAALIAIILPVLFLVPSLRTNVAALAAVALLASSGPALASLFMIVVPVEIAGSAGAATAIGLVAIGGEAIGATGGPLIGGWLADAYGAAAPLWLSAAAAVGMVVVSMFIRESRSRSC